MNNVYKIVLLLLSISCFSQQKIDVYFQSGEANAYLEENTSLMVALENKNIEVLKIQGFCDPTGSKKYNKKLSDARINSVLKLFTDEEIKIYKKIKIESFGENFKLDSNNEFNRKVIVYYKSLSFKEEEFQDLSKEITTLKKGDLLKIKNLNFYNNSAQLLNKSISVLDDLIEVLQKNLNLKIEIQGHICCKTKLEPDVVSGARAKYIYSVLIENGIDSSRLKYKGYGVSKPIFSIPEKNEEEQEANRRVEILILDN